MSDSADVLSPAGDKRLFNLNDREDELIGAERQIRSNLQTMEQMQMECLERVSQLEGTLHEVLRRLEGGGVDESEAAGDEAMGLMGMKKAMPTREVEKQMYAFQRCLDNTMVFMDVTMRHIIHKKLRRDCVGCQTDSTSIAAQEVGAQTSEEILDDSVAEKLLFSLPDLEKVISELRIDTDTQTDLQMDHFTSTNKSAHDGVIIYHNPNISSFPVSYILAVAGLTLGVIVCYKVVRYVVVLRSVI